MIGRKFQDVKLNACMKRKSRKTLNSKSIGLTIIYFLYNTIILSICKYLN